jgi:isopentenyldiphosphate isomerase
MNDSHVRSLAVAVNERYQKLARPIQQLPPHGSRPLAVASRVSGWITAKATQALAGLPGVRVLPEAVYITASISPRMPLNAVLVEVALALKKAGCLRGWRDELLDVFGEGRCLGVIERAAVRPLGLLTRAVHLNAWTPDGKLWIARRSETKTTDPGKWDTLVGGLAGTGESLDTALLRESNEEAGLIASDLENRSPLKVLLRMHRRLPEGYQVEDVLVSECILAERIAPENQDGEVSEIRTAAVDEVWALIQAKEFTVEAELVLLEGLRNRIQDGLIA